MSKITSLSTLSNVKDPATFIRMASQVISDIVGAISGKISFQDNIQCQSVTVTFSTKNIDVGVQHGLGKTGVSYFPVNKSVACDVFAGVTQSSSGTIYLQSSAAPATVTLILF